MPLLSLRGYAKHRGVSLSAVQKAIKSGRITTTTDGQIDSAQADAKWEKRTRPGQKRAAAVRTVIPAPEPPRTDAAGGLDYFKARAIRESYLARRHIHFDGNCLWGVFERENESVLVKF
jgi:pyruvate/2-oxoglutarate dehydrogenase complex dihydrolipoamide acyltransferase (E2) component